MIRVRVELISAVTGKTTEIARMHITNTGGGTLKLGNYFGETFRGRDADTLSKCTVSKPGKVANYPRLQLHVWNLVRRMLDNMGYTK